jgi:hypothetical protein
MEVSFLFWLITGEKFGNLKNCLVREENDGVDYSDSKSKYMIDNLDNPSLP